MHVDVFPECSPLPIALKYKYLPHTLDYNCSCQDFKICDGPIFDGNFFEKYVVSYSCSVAQYTPYHAAKGRDEESNSTTNAILGELIDATTLILSTTPFVQLL